MKHNLSEQVNLLLEYIDTADAVCVGAAAGMSIAAGVFRKTRLIQKTPYCPKN